MDRMTKRDLEDENRRLREALEELYDRIGDALSVVDDVGGRQNGAEALAGKDNHRVPFVATPRTRSESASTSQLPTRRGRQTGLCPPDRPLRPGGEIERPARLTTPQPDGRPPRR